MDFDDFLIEYAAASKKTMFGPRVGFSLPFLGVQPPSEPKSPATPSKLKMMDSFPHAKGTFMIGHLATVDSRPGMFCQILHRPTCSPTKPSSLFSPNQSTPLKSMTNLTDFALGFRAGKLNEETSECPSTWDIDVAQSSRGISVSSECSPLRLSLGTHVAIATRGWEQGNQSKLRVSLWFPDKEQHDVRQLKCTGPFCILGWSGLWFPFGPVDADPRHGNIRVAPRQKPNVPCRCAK